MNYTKISRFTDEFRGPGFNAVSVWKHIPKLLLQQETDLASELISYYNHLQPETVLSC